MSPEGNFREGEPRRVRAQVRRYGPGEASGLREAAGMQRRSGAPADAGPGVETTFSLSGLPPVSTPVFRPGDFILTHSRGFTARLIRFGQALRYAARADRPYSRWSHAALIVSPEGDLIEAVGRGIVRTPISHYDPTEFYLVQLADDEASAHDRVQMVKFAERWLGARYGIATIVSIAISLLTGSRFTFGIDGQFICSGLVASGLERTAVIFDRGSAHMMPADLAKHFGVRPDPNAPDKGRPPGPNWPP